MSLNRVLALSCALIFLSCAARKRSLSKNEKAGEMEYDVKRTDNSTIETNILTIKTENKTVYEPINKEIPIIVNSDTISNARVTITNSDTNSQIAINDTKNVEETDRSEINIEQSNKEVQTEREGFNWEGLKWALIFILLIIVAWIVYRLRYKR